MNKLLRRFKSIDRLSLSLLLLSSVGFLSGCTIDNHANLDGYVAAEIFGTFDWASLELSSQAPDPHTTYGFVNSTSESYLNVYAGNMTYGEYVAYESEARKMGYGIDINTSWFAYESSNGSGYYLHLRYDPEGDYTLIELGKKETSE